MLERLEQEVKPFTVGSQPFLMVLDQASFHRTTRTLNWFRLYFITPAIILSGCTSLLQPLDTAINKTFKGVPERHTEALTKGHINTEDLSKWSAEGHRIIITKAVVNAWVELDISVVQKSFIECGISINPNGHQDDLVRIKDPPDISWAGWETEYSNPALKPEENDQLELEEDKDNDIFKCSDGADGHPYSAESLHLNFKKPILRDLLDVRKLPVSGVKTVLVARLCIDD
jgi:hypothetical protein